MVQPSPVFRHMCLHGVVVGRRCPNKAFYFDQSAPTANLAPNPIFVGHKIYNCARCPRFREVHLPVTVNMRGVGFRDLLSVGGGGNQFGRKAPSIIGRGGGGSRPSHKTHSAERHCPSLREFIFGFLIHCNWWDDLNTEIQTHTSVNRCYCCVDGKIKCLQPNFTTGFGKPVQFHGRATDVNPG